MNEITLEPGWLERQIKATERERELWANWFRGEKSKGRNMERDLESKLFEAWGRKEFLRECGGWNRQTTEWAERHYKALERFRAGERSPELLAEIEALTAQLKESET